MLLPLRKQQRPGNGPHTGRRPAARSRPPRPPPPLGRWPQQQQRSGVQQQRRAPGSSSGERRAAAATESSLVQARTSSFKANIDPQPPSTVVEMARQQSGDQVRSPQRVGGHGVRPPRNLGLARACSMFSRVLFSFLSPFPLNCLRVCGLSLPFFLSPSLSHHLSLPPSMRGSGRVGRWRGGVRGGGGLLRACGWWAGGRVGMGVHETRARVRAWTGRDRDVPPNSAQWAYTIVCGCVRESRCVSESVCIWGLGGVSGGDHTTRTGP